MYVTKKYRKEHISPKKRRRSKEILIVHTSWYEQYISEMLNISKEILKDFDCDIATAPGALELYALALHKISKNGYHDSWAGKNVQYVGIIFLGIVIRGETSHYDLVTQETFRSINVLSENHPQMAIINNVICVENKEQLEARLIKNTTNNTKALIQLINEKSS